MLLPLFLAALLLAPPTPPPLPSVSLPSDLTRVLTDYQTAWQARDATALAALFAADGFVLSGGHAPLRGRSEIQRFYAGRGGPLALRALHYEVEGSVGFILGAYARKPGAPDEGKFTLTLRKDSTGRWQIVSDMDNGNQAWRPGAQ